MSAELVDVSSFQDPASIDWARVLAAGVEGVYVKLTDGIGSPDPRAAAHVRGAKDAGLLVGGYHYYHPRIGPQDTDAQAREFSAMYLDLGCDLRPAGDFEPDTNPHVSAMTWLDGVEEFSDVVTQCCACRPLVYSFPAFWRSLQPETRPELELYGLWVATYAAAPANMPPWSSEALWQYTDAGIVDGIPGHVDRSRARGGIEALRRVAA